MTLSGYSLFFPYIAGFLQYVLFYPVFQQNLRYDVEKVNLRFTWYRDPLGLTRKTSQTFYVNMPWSNPLCMDEVVWLNGIRVDSATWRVNAQMLGSLYASLSLNVRWYGSFAEGRTGYITGKFKGAIPIPNTPGYMFVPTGGFSYGVNLRGKAIIHGIYIPD